MPGPRDCSLSTLPIRATCPRAIRCRSISLTSPSHLAKIPGSLMLGLKKRWLTVRTSTLTAAAPTLPSAEPTPVMLDIMWLGATFLLARVCSIPELPSQTVETDRAWHVEIRHYLVNLSEHVPHLIGRNAPQYADFYERRQDAARSRLSDSMGNREGNAGPILIDHSHLQAEVAAGKLGKPTGHEIDL